jgi:hypothetical protein
MLHIFRRRIPYVMYRLLSAKVVLMSSIRYLMPPRMLLAAFVLHALLVWGIGAYAEDRSTPLDKKLEIIGRDLAINGEFVHNVGQLQMNVTNWGFLGALPNSQFPMSDSPSAQWPAGSGIEYLYAAGLWIGALRSGVPIVSTGYPETELYPPQGPVNTIYRSRYGDAGGIGYPDNPDDDRDGLIDEDWLNGLDDDLDGLIDEDFRAIGEQMFSCVYTDDQEMAKKIWPEHTPMRVTVRQESYQWSEEGADNFVVVRYFISNHGSSFLTNVYLGIYADVDAGPLYGGSYYLDDMVGYHEEIRCVTWNKEELPVRHRVAYVYDADGDKGLTTGYFGISIINYPVSMGSYKGEPVPLPAGLGVSTNAFRHFSGLQTYQDGGDPINDMERYQALSTRTIDNDTDTPRDYRILLSVGPFSLLPGGSPFILDVAFVCGEGFEGMMKALGRANIYFRGCWVDHDKDPTTGVIGRETPVMGPRDDWYPDPCNNPELKVDIPAKEICWTNMDCSWEILQYNGFGCYRDPATNPYSFKTGIYGREHQVLWVEGAPPPAPNMRLAEGDHMVTILWDNFSEIALDPLTQIADFEGYQIWRADDWHRPLGSSILTGPERHLWRMLDSRDIVNGVPPDKAFDMPFAEGGWQYDPLGQMEDRDQLISLFEESIWYAPIDTVPCPPGLTDDECDTLEALARYNLGFEGSRQYYKYVDAEAKNGLPYFYSVTAYDHKLRDGVPVETGRFSKPTANFAYAEARTNAQELEEFDRNEIYVVPNPVTNENMEPWRLGPTNSDPSGLKCEFRNLPACRGTVRIFTVSGDLVQTLEFDGRDGAGTQSWNLISRNGQDIASGVYLFSVEPDDGRFGRTIGKFIVIR